MIFAETNDGLKSQPVEIQIKNDAYNEAQILNIELDPNYFTEFAKKKYLNVRMKHLFEKRSISYI